MFDATSTWKERKIPEHQKSKPNKIDICILKLQKNHMNNLFLVKHCPFNWLDETILSHWPLILALFTVRIYAIHVAYVHEYTACQPALCVYCIHSTEYTLCICKCACLCTQNTVGIQIICNLSGNFVSHGYGAINSISSRNSWHTFRYILPDNSFRTT